MRRASLLTVLLLSSVSVRAADVPVPPVAATKPHTVTAPHGAARQDDYYWLRDDTRKNADMLAYLGAENAYTEAWMKPLEPLKDRLFKEYVSRIKQDDNSVPILENGYYYYSRFVKGADYPVTARKKGSLSAPEEVLFDQPKMSEGTTYFSIGDYQVSDDNRLVAYAEDKVGRRQYVVQVKDLKTGKLLDDRIENAEANLVWMADNKTILYVEKDPVTLLSKRIKAHVLGTPSSADRLVYEEKDDSFYISLFRTTGRNFVCIAGSATTMTEANCTPATRLDGFTLVAPRRKDHLYQADEIGGRWVIRSNKNSANYQLYRFATADLGKSDSTWTAITPASSDFIDDFSVFDGFVAIAERSGGNKRVRVLTDRGASKAISANDPAFSMSLTGNREAKTDWVRYTYSSLVQPTQTIEYNVRTGQRRVLKTQPTPGYNPANYATERTWIAARDGTKVPVSLVYKKGFKKDGTAAMLQYAYGSYGFSTDPSYNTVVTSLLDRGMVYAIAHIRGGQEMGRQWYDDGHLQKKINSFTDFIDVTRGLVEQGYAAKGRVAAMGGSAGGLLMGGVTNMAPQDYKVMITLVPFVDVLTTMLDPTIPLTTNEYDEWGNPERAADYQWMAAYSPYDNIKRQDYPAIWVGTGLWDSQVQYYEPAKYVARLRAMKTDRNPLLFKVNMDSGHGGKSGRFRKFEEQAEYEAFMLNQLGINR